MEEWKSIPGYEGLYEISSYGRVKSLDRYVKVKSKSYRLQKGKMLSPIKNKYGYLQVFLCCNGKYKIISVHRLVALTFIPNPDNLPMINHKDEVKTNNSVDNLEWCTEKYNSNYKGVLKRRSQRMKENGIYEKIALKIRKYPDTVGLDEKEYRNYYMREYRKRKRGQ